MTHIGECQSHRRNASPHRPIPPAVQTELVVITVGQLRELIREAVREELAATAIAGPRKPPRAHPAASASVELETQGEASAWLTTAEAAAYLKTTVTALNRHVSRGNLSPDSHAQRSRFRGHRYSQATLDAFMREPVAAQGPRRQVPRLRNRD
jgi:hypothetical protein